MPIASVTSERVEQWMASVRRRLLWNQRLQKGAWAVAATLVVWGLLRHLPSNSQHAPLLLAAAASAWIGLGAWLYWRERAWDLARVAGWADRHLDLRDRLVTFVAFYQAPVRPRFFSALSNQVFLRVRGLPPHAVAPLQWKRPVTVALAALAIAVWLWQKGRPPDSLAVTAAPGSQSAPEGVGDLFSALATDPSAASPAASAATGRAAPDARLFPSAATRGADPSAGQALTGLDFAGAEAGDESARSRARAEPSAPNARARASGSDLQELEHHVAREDHDRRLAANTTDKGGKSTSGAAGQRGRASQGEEQTEAGNGRALGRGKETAPRHDVQEHQPGREARPQRQTGQRGEPPFPSSGASSSGAGRGVAAEGLFGKGEEGTTLEVARPNEPPLVVTLSGLRYVPVAGAQPGAHAAPDLVPPEGHGSLPSASGAAFWKHEVPLEFREIYRTLHERRERP